MTISEAPSGATQVTAIATSSRQQSDYRSSFCLEGVIGRRGEQSSDDNKVASMSTGSGGAVSGRGGIGERRASCDFCSRRYVRDFTRGLMSCVHTEDDITGGPNSSKRMCNELPLATSAPRPCSPHDSALTHGKYCYRV